ncbi:MAG: GNAT family N-acetyltransferase [Clostridia bacterium]|nr:GNAT family N-acetyltransferase [Clostridia bacterium]
MPCHENSFIQKTPQLHKLNDVGTQNIETKRILLRKFKVEDSPYMYNNWAKDPEVSRFLNWLPHRSIEETEELLTLWETEYQKAHCYRWCIVHKELDEPIGSIDVVHIFEDACCCEVGYAMSRNFWGQGIMTEVFKEVIAYLFEKANFNRIQARFDVENVASGKVMQKAGLSYEGTMRQSNTKNTGQFCSCSLYSILREEWLKNKEIYRETNFASNKNFWVILDQLVKSSEIIIDRPKNSAHPKFKEAIYPLDYGYLQGTTSADLEGIDVFVGSLRDKSISGILCTVDLLQKDSEIKILLDCTEEEMILAHNFLNTTTFFKNLLIRK